MEDIDETVILEANTMGQTSIKTKHPIMKVEKIDILNDSLDDGGSSDKIIGSDELVAKV